jgi:hypothetical protein
MHLLHGMILGRSPRHYPQFYFSCPHKFPVAACSIMLGDQRPCGIIRLRTPRRVRDCDGRRNPSWRRTTNEVTNTDTLYWQSTLVCVGDDHGRTVHVPENPRHGISSRFTRSRRVVASAASKAVADPPAPRHQHRHRQRSAGSASSLATAASPSLRSPPPPPTSPDPSRTAMKTTTTIGGRPARSAAVRRALAAWRGGVGGAGV